MVCGCVVCVCGVYDVWCVCGVYGVCGVCGDGVWCVCLCMVGVGPRMGGWHAHVKLGEKAAAHEKLREDLAS